MSNKPEEFVVEPTPVVDLSKHLLSEGPENFSANDPLESWDNEKTEVYVDSEDDTGNAALIDENGDRHPITAFPYILGRGNECDFVLTGKGVSRKHAEIIFQSGRFVINDLQSLNGIKVNGYKVNRVILEESDAVKLGEVLVTFTSGKAEDSKAKKRPKKNAETAALKSGDDPFGKSPAKKAMFAVSGVAVGIFLLAGGFYFYQQNQSALEQRAIVVPSKPPVTKTPQAATAPVVQAAAATNKVSSLPKNTFAPPPSLSAAPVGLSTKPKPVIEKPEIVKPSKVIAKKPVSKKPTISRETTKAKSLLSSSNQRYLSGDADALFSEMNRYENNSKVSSSARASLKSKHEALAKLYNDYMKGKEAHVAGNKDLAFEHWGRYMESEKGQFGKSRSVYADQVAVKVIEEYVSRGNAAAKAGKNHEAYRLWQKSLGIGESVAAKIAIETADAKAKQLYRKALRLEYVNSNKAKELWQDVVNMVPPGSEYHTKASSKLAWYDRWGA